VTALQVFICVLVAFCVCDLGVVALVCLPPNGCVFLVCWKATFFESLLLPNILVSKNHSNSTRLSIPKHERGSGGFRVPFFDDLVDVRMQCILLLLKGQIAVLL
jgi:hypothetical protein